MRVEISAKTTLSTMRPALKRSASALMVAKERRARRGPQKAPAQTMVILLRPRMVSSSLEMKRTSPVESSRTVGDGGGYWRGRRLDVGSVPYGKGAGVVRGNEGDEDREKKRRTIPPNSVSAGCF